MRPRGREREPPPPPDSFPLSYEAGWRLLRHAVRKAHSGAHRQTQLGLKPLHTLVLHSPPGPLAQGLGQAARGARQTFLTTHTVEGAQGGPAQGAAVLETKNWPKGPGKGSLPTQYHLCHFPPPLLNETLRLGVKLLPHHHLWAPKGPQGADMNSVVPPEMRLAPSVQLSAGWRRGGS